MNLHDNDPYIHGTGIQQIGAEFWRDRDGKLHLIGSPPQGTTREQYTRELTAAGFTPADTTIPSTPASPPA